MIVCNTCKKFDEKATISYMICPECIEEQKKDLGQQRFKIKGIWLGCSLEKVVEVIIYKMNYLGSHGWEFKAWYADDGGSEVNDGEYIRGEEIIITGITGVNECN